MLQFISPPLPHFIYCGEDTYAPGGKHPDRSSIGVFDLLLVTRTGKLQSSDSAHIWLRQLLMLQHDSSSTSNWRQQLLFQELLLQLQEETKLPASSSYLSIADEAAAFLRRNYRDAFTYKTMSEALHFHANYISLCMKRAYGCTPLDYLTRYRVEQAKRLLIDTNEAIGRIAESTGFGSFPYFVRCFKHLTGITPKAFRSQYRQI